MDYKNRDYSTLKALIDIDSPSGYTRRAEEYVASLMQQYGYQPEFTRKRSVRVRLSDHAPKLALAAHLDTLGGIVEQIRDDGTLKISMIGGYPPNSFEGSYVRIYTLAGKCYTGSFLINNPSTHASREVGSAERSLKNMHIRIDETVCSEDEVRDLGIRVGDFVCFEPHYHELESGYIKSRFMDNKSGCYVLFEVARELAESGEAFPVELIFTNYEEVGHGGATGYSPSTEELLVIDMAVIGEGISGSEQKVSICAKDTSGPYDFEFRKRLTELAEEDDIPYETAIYPYYGSDGSAALRAGMDLRVGLIGPGVSASHGVERTHKEGVDATIRLALAYIRKYARNQQS